MDLEDELDDFDGGQDYNYDPEIEGEEGMYQIVSFVGCGISSPEYRS